MIHWAITLRNRARSDRRLSDKAFRVLDFIIHTVVASRQPPEAEEIPLPWSRIAGWVDCEKDTAYSVLRNLEDLGYLRREGRKTVPATVHFFLVPSWREKPPTGWREKPPTGRGSRPPTGWRTNPPSPYYKTPPGEKTPKKEALPSSDASHYVPPADGAPVDWDQLRREASL